MSTLVVVEGPFDALAIDRLDRHVAALRGSDLSPAHASKLQTWGRLLVATDPDLAGEKAYRAIAGLRRHVEVRRVKFPDGRDPGALEPEHLAELLASA